MPSELQLDLPFSQIRFLKILIVLRIFSHDVLDSKSNIPELHCQVANAQLVYYCADFTPPISSKSDRLFN
jgi:hypothetical protein